MAERSEALTQIARLLGDANLRSTDDDSVRAAVDQRFSALIESLLDETAASDDVFSRESALAYLEDRLAFLGVLLTEEQIGRLREAARERLEAW
jgi:hypothetical protein